MSTRVRLIGGWETLVQRLARWRTFRLPDTPRVDCPKARAQVGASTSMNWAHMAGQAIGALDVHRVPSDGIASGMPMQQGGPVERAVWWGQWGYSHRASVPRPADGGRFWVTGYPVPWFDRRCIIAGPDPREVHELIQFDQDAPRRANGLPQHAMAYARWRDGVLVDGKAITAAGLPGHMYLWGPGSADDPHQQALVIDNYVGGKDGTLADGPVCGEWVVLDNLSASYTAMIAAGGECAARALALVTFGARIIDRNGIDMPTPNPPWLLTQAGAWTAGTNLASFRVPLADLRRVVG